MNQINLDNKPMNFYNYFHLLMQGKGNLSGLGAITFLSGGFVLNPTILTGLVPIVTGVLMFLLSIWQKNKVETRNDELHKQDMLRIRAENKRKEEQADVLASIQAEELEAARLETQLLRAKLRKIEEAN